MNIFIQSLWAEVSAVKEQMRNDPVRIKRRKVSIPGLAQLHIRAKELIFEYDFMCIVHTQTMQQERRLPMKL